MFFAHNNYKIIKNILPNAISNKKKKECFFVLHSRGETAININ